MKNERFTSDDKEQEEQREGQRKEQELNKARIKFLEQKKELTPCEEAELKARKETGNVRIALLESKRASGEKLTPDEENELKILRKIANLRIALLESRKADSEKLTPVEESKLNRRREKLKQKENE